MTFFKGYGRRLKNVFKLMLGSFVPLVLVALPVHLLQAVVLIIRDDGLPRWVTFGFAMVWLMIVVVLGPFLIHNGIMIARSFGWYDFDDLE